MSLPKRYNPHTTEPRLEAEWQENGVYHYDPDSDVPTYAIDTPPPTVSGYLHLGHVYSYTHTDVMARFWRMKGHNVFYPMGFDDNGLPTERLVERQLGIRAMDVGRDTFIEHCLATSDEAEKDYEALWQRLGLSIDWRYAYRTIGELARKTSQWSFIDLYRKGLVYRQKAPTIWCPECRTAIAQAELDDLERETTFYTLAFKLENGDALPIATTRPELLAACVSVFVHPEDQRFTSLIGQKVTVPLFGQKVEILADEAADPEKGTGIVMCCTFGDTTDVEWWYKHNLPLIEAIGRDGKLTSVAGDFAGDCVPDARRKIVEALDDQGLLLERKPTSQSVRIHERCDTPVEYIVTQQWFVRVLDYKDDFIAAGEQIEWHPPQMKNRYREWVENLNWDWCISRQRYFGVTFPVWYCDNCGEIMLADEDQLPIDPSTTKPSKACSCGSTSFSPETDVMDTWATSSLSPQIVAQFLQDKDLHGKLMPMSLRPQAHEIIRTWAFYTIVKSHHHFGTLPWREVAISGWGLAPEGSGKISKSRGGGPIAPLELIQEYSADAVRYWATSTGFGKDSVISVEKVQVGAKLVNKLWNVARFSSRFLEGYQPTAAIPTLTPADRWIMARLQKLIRRITSLFEGYDYAAAKSEIEGFFWKDLADNYLEMAKQRLYDDENPTREGGQFALYHSLLTILKLFAPFMPYVTETIYQQMFSEADGSASIHNAAWPTPILQLEDDHADLWGDTLVTVATTIRRYKSDNQLSLTTELTRLQLATAEIDLVSFLQDAAADLRSVTRAQQVEVVPEIDASLETLSNLDETVGIGIERA